MMKPGLFLATFVYSFREIIIPACSITFGLSLRSSRALAGISISPQNVSKPDISRDASRQVYYCQPS